MPIPAHKTGETTVKLFHETARGRILLGDSLGMFRDEIKPGAIDLIMTSPPFGLVRKKDYGTRTRMITWNGFARSPLRSTKL